MKLFIFELVSAGGMGPKPPPTLRDEGWAMLAALVTDFDRIDGVETLTLIDRSCPRLLGRVCQPIGPGEEPDGFREMVARADLVLVIAPECAQFLADRSRWVLEAGKLLLGSDPGAIDLSGDKLALAQHLDKHGIPTPATILLSGDSAAAGTGQAFPAICKPRYGAGSQATFLIRNATEFSLHLDQARLELPGADFLLQPLVPGQPASVTFLVGPCQTLALQPASQCLSTDGRFHYLGGCLPLDRPLARRASALAQQAIGTVAGLGGFIGVDLVLGEAADGSHDCVIEINPRPTTSYLGLRQLAEDNLADAMLRIVRGEKAAPLRWRPGPIQFSC
jgi:predicted ATP-grasp superfamily ATP-dependent carboligase